MPWIFLFFAGLLEIVWAFAMKESHGFTRVGYTTLMAAAMAAPFALLALAMRDLPLGTAYAIWTGIGALGAFAVGLVILGEPATPGRLIAAGLILTGIVTMKLTS